MRAESARGRPAGEASGLYQPGNGAGAGGVAVLRAPAFGTRVAPVPARRFSDVDLVVDLGSDLFSRRWWRGLGTLVLLCGTVAFLAPDLGPIAGGRPAPMGEVELEQMEALGIAPLSESADTGLRMAETAAVEPLSSAPERPTIELFATLGRGDSVAQLLLRAGATAADAAAAGRLIAGAAPRGIAPGTSIAVTLGKRLDGGSRPIERLALRAALALKVTVQRGPAGLELTRIPIAVDTTPLRIRGRVGDGLYWSLRAAGVSTDAASAYLQALASQIDVGSEVSPDDKFDLVIANSRAATGETIPGALLYAGLDRIGARDFQLMRWPVGGRTQWLEASGVGQQTSGMMWPVQGRITSGYGTRVHPILRFARFHKGIDFGARWGSPIVAAADGQVIRAGWAGGYGQQVRLAHGSGVVTTYSHMSRITAPAGSIVRQGDLIGYVGSTGLSTGPHLHYEVYRDGAPVNPLNVRFASRSQLEGAELEAFRNRLRAMLSIGVGS